MTPRQSLMSSSRLLLCVWATIIISQENVPHSVLYAFCHYVYFFVVFLHDIRGKQRPFSLPLYFLCTRVMLSELCGSL